MSLVVDHYFSLISPFAYLGFERLEAIAARHGAEVRHKPINLAEVFPATGGLPLAKRAPERQAYRLAELVRWRSYLGLPLNLHPKHFPAPEWPAAGMVLAAGRAGGDPGGLARAILRAVWAEERNIADEATLAELASATGQDGAALLAAANTDEIRAHYAAISREAIDSGVFGSPTYVLNGEVFWGQDRLDFLDRALEAAGRP